MRFNKRVADSLRRSGFTLTAWGRNVQFTVDNQIIKFGEVHGLINADDRRLQVIAIANEQPGNGDFGRAMDALEAAARGRRLAVEVTAIFNPRLRLHLALKRGYRAKNDSQDAAMVLDPAPHVGRMTDKISTHEKTN
jgi:hypothetical protein